MITLGPVQSLAASADTANMVHCFLEADTITPGATPPDLFAGKGPLLLGTAAQVLLAAAAGQQILLKSIALYSAADAPVTVAIYSNGTAAANQRFGLTLPAGGKAAYEDGRGWVVYDRNGLALSSLVPLTVPLPVNQGGTGAAALTANAVLVGNGTGAVLAPAALGWDGSLLSAPGLNLTGAGVPANGVYLAGSDVLGFASGGAARCTLDAGGRLAGAAANAWALLDASASATQPTLLPNGGDAGSGIGAAAAGSLSEIVSGSEVGRWTAAGLGVMLAGSPAQGALSLSAAAAGGAALAVQGLAAQSGAYARIADSGGNLLHAVQPLSAGDPRTRQDHYNSLEAVPANYERGSIYFDNPNNLYRIETQNGGTGTLRSMALQAGGGRLLLGTTIDNGVTPVQVDSTAQIAAVGSTQALAVTYTPPAFVPSSSIAFSVSVSGPGDPGGTSDVRGLGFGVTLSGAANSVNGIGVQGNVFNSSSGVMSNGSAASVAVRNTGSGSITTANGLTTTFVVSSGNIASAYHLHASTPSISGSGAITAAVGLRIEGQKVTGIANGYGVQQAGASDLNYFAGKAQFGSTASADAYVKLAAGTSTAGTSPLKLTAGTNLAAPEAGALEFDGNLWYATPSSATRMTVAMSKPVGAAVTAATYTQLQSDTELLFNSSGGCTITLLPAASYPGRKLWVQNISAQTLLSGSSNVIPNGSTTAGATILPATAGAWAVLESNGSNWQVLAISGSGGSGGSGMTVLGVAQVNSTTTQITYTSTSTTAVPVDATNLSITFVAPSTGNVLVTLEGMAENATNTLFQVWCLLDGTNTPLAGYPGIGNAILTNVGVYYRMRSTFWITGLMPGGSYTYRWGWRAWSSATLNMTLFAGVDPPASGSRGPIGSLLMMVQG
jgi:hypothetical protein